MSVDSTEDNVEDEKDAFGNEHNDSSNNKESVTIHDTNSIAANKLDKQKNINHRTKVTERRKPIPVFVKL